MCKLLMINDQLPYSRKFSRDPIFAERQSAKISRSNFRGWTFQNCSTHKSLGAWLRLLPHAQRTAEPADKLAKMTRRNGMRVAYDRRSYGPVVITCTRKFWCAAVGGRRHFRRQRATWIMKLGSIARHLE